MPSKREGFTDEDRYTYIYIKITLLFRLSRGFILRTGGLDSINSIGIAFLFVVGKTLPGR